MRAFNILLIALAYLILVVTDFTLWIELREAKATLRSCTEALTATPSTPRRSP